MADTNVYRIRHKPTGLFSTGGTGPRFTKKGKSWSCLAHVRLHLAQFKWSNGNGWAWPYKDCEVVTYGYVETGVVDIEVERTRTADRQAEKASEQTRKRQEELEAGERAQLAYLKRKYPDKP